jgi:cellulose synthase/poly-beta-1,6-N-acetylglucosamine synthase-like glycosyltransferase
LITVYAYVVAWSSARVAPPPRGTPPRLFFVLLVPMLNEGAVIGRTLESLLALAGNFAILLIDDASDDGTLAVVGRHGGDGRVHVLQRGLPEARRRKGAALNAGYAALRRLGLVEGYAPEEVVVVVFDADGRVDPTFLSAMAPYFTDPRTGGVQSAVRMYNAGKNLLTTWQHFEFIVWDEVFCRAKDRLGSATLGGNGQCTRLSALDTLGPEPRRPSLTEDLDLSLRLLVGGWRLRFCPRVAVWQEAVPRLRALVRQRSRWLQGHLVSWCVVPALLRAPHPLAARLDTVLFMLLPIVFVPIGIASVGSWLAFLLDFGHWDSQGFVELLSAGLRPGAARHRGLGSHRARIVAPRAIAWACVCVLLVRLVPGCLRRVVEHPGWQTRVGQDKPRHDHPGFAWAANGRLPELRDGDRYSCPTTSHWDPGRRRSRSAGWLS